MDEDKEEVGNKTTNTQQPKIPFIELKKSFVLIRP